MPNVFSRPLIPAFILATALICACLPSHAQAQAGVADEFLAGYLLCVEGEALEKSGKLEQAYQKFTEASKIVDAVALLPWFVWLGTDLNLTMFNDGLVRLTVGTGIFATAVVTLIIRARMSGLDESLEESAADLYATPWNRFRQITLPLMAPAIIAAALLAFTLSLDNTIIASFITVAGTDTLPVYIFSSVRSALRPEIASVSTVLFVLTLAAIALVALVLRRGGDSSTQITQTMTGAG